jgi:hypothetical protein
VPSATFSAVKRNCCSPALRGSENSVATVVPTGSRSAAVTVAGAPSV